MGGFAVMRSGFSMLNLLVAMPLFLVSGVVLTLFTRILWNGINDHLLVSLTTIGLSIAANVRLLHSVSIFHRGEDPDPEYYAQWEKWAPATIIVLILSSAAAAVVVGLVRRSI
jgi:hypothetical protein